MSPQETAAIVGKAVSSSPGGKVGAVTKPGSESIMDSILGPLKTVGSAAKSTLFNIFGASDLGVPGTAPIARAAGYGVAKVTDAGSKAIHKVSDAVATDIKAAGKGLESGFKIGAFVIVLIVGLWIWSVARPR